MTRKAALTVIFLFIINTLLFGCQDRSKDILGAWKSSSTGANGKIQIAVFEENQMILNGKYKSSVTYKDEGKKLVAHLDQTSWYIDFLDKDTIMVTNGNSGFGGTTKYLRTSIEEAESIITQNNAKPKREPMGW